jgi:hypothetical protein
MGTTAAENAGGLFARRRSTDCKQETLRWLEEALQLIRHYDAHRARALTCLAPGE